MVIHKLSDKERDQIVLVAIRLIIIGSITEAIIKEARCLFVCLQQRSRLLLMDISDFTLQLHVGPRKFFFLLFRWIIPLPSQVKSPLDSITSSPQLPLFFKVPLEASRVRACTAVLVQNVYKSIHLVCLYPQWSGNLTIDDIESDLKGLSGLCQF